MPSLCWSRVGGGALCAGATISKRGKLTGENGRKCDMGCDRRWVDDDKRRTKQTDWASRRQRLPCPVCLPPSPTPSRRPLTTAPRPRRSRRAQHPSRYSHLLPPTLRLAFVAPPARPLVPTSCTHILSCTLRAERTWACSRARPRCVHSACSRACPRYVHPSPQACALVRTLALLHRRAHLLVVLYICRSVT